MNFKIYIKSFYKAMTDMKKLMGSWKYEKLNILRTKRSL